MIRTPEKTASASATAEPTDRPLIPWLRACPISAALVVVVTVGLLWRVLRYVLAFPIWGDEAFVAVNFLVRDYRGMIEPLVWGQIVPVAFMWADLAMARAFGVGELSLRFIPFAAGVLSVPLFWRLAALLLPQRAAALAVAIFAVSIYLVRHAAEVKPYSTDMLISLLVTLAGVSVVRRPGSVWAWGALCALSAAGPWCSYPMVFVAAAVWLFVAWHVWKDGRRPARFGALFVSGALLLANFAAMYWLIGGPHAQFAARLTEIPMWKPTFPPVLEPWKLPVWFVLIHTGNMFAYPHGSANGGSTATFLLVVIGAVSLWWSDRSRVWLLLGPLAFTFLAAAFEKYPYGGSARTSLYMAPAFCLLAGLGGHELLRRLLRGEQVADGVKAACFGLAIFGVGACVADLRKPYKDKAVQLSYQHVRTLAQRAQSDDLWVVFNAIEPCDYAPYLGEWRGTGAQFVFDLMRFRPTRAPILWAPRPEDVPPPPPGGRVWLLAYHGVRVEFPREQFDAYRAALVARFGEPRKEFLKIKERDGREEGVDVHEFGPVSR